MSLTTISWTTLLPSDTSKVGIGPKDIRSIWTAVDTGLNHSDCPMYWSAESRGEARPGVFRTYYGLKSLSSPGRGNDSVGRLYFASDTSQLITYTTSAISRVVGSRFMIEHDTKALGGTMYASEGSYAVHTTTGSVAVTFKTPWSTAPTVVTFPTAVDNISAATGITSTGFNSFVSYVGAGADAAGNVYYYAFGRASSEAF